MASFNRITILGNLVRKPELRYIPSGTAVCTMTVATNRKYKQGDDWKDSTCFIEVEVWGRQAETSAEYLDKGRQVLIDGRLDQDRWDSQDGTKRSKHKIVASQVVFVGSRQSSSGTSSSTHSADKPVEDDIPF